MLCVPRGEAGQAVPMVLQPGYHQHQLEPKPYVYFKPSYVSESQPMPLSEWEPELSETLLIFRRPF